jgi:hypothetical protein
MHSLTLQQIQDQPVSSDSKLIPAKRKILTGHWIKVDGRLICQWNTRED